MATLLYEEVTVNTFIAQSPHDYLVSRVYIIDDSINICAWLLIQYKYEGSKKKRLFIHLNK